MENQSDNLNATTPNPSPNPETVPTDTPAQGGIFSSSDTRIETENLPTIQPSPMSTAPNGTITPSLRTESTVTGDLKLGGQKKKGRWSVIVIGAVAIVSAIAIVALLLGNHKLASKANVVGDVNLNYLFDETAPIPAEQSGQYGYLDPENGGWTITPQYLSASSFYGDYAAVSYSQANVQKTAIINRSGETVVVQESGSVDAYYDIQNNIWVVGGDVYDSSMQKLNADGTTGNYIGNGYILSSAQIEKNINGNQETVSDSDEADEEGVTSSVESTVESGSTYTETISKIEDLKGNVHYDCQTLCVANTTSDREENVYAVVRGWGEPAKIIKLPGGEVLYTASGTNQIHTLHDVTFAEDTGNAKKYLKVEDGKVAIVSSKVEDIRATISNTGEYYAEECNGRNSILKINGETVMKCDVQAYTELSENTYLMYQATFSKDLLFIEREDKIELVNLKDANVLHAFELGVVTTYDNSPFFYVLADNGTAKVCNLLKGTDKCIDVEDSNADITGFGNYFTVTSGSNIKTYNANLEMIHE